MQFVDCTIGMLPSLLAVFCLMSRLFCS